MQTNPIGLHIIVKGRVQGVCFRYYTEQKAHHLGITGTVKNLYDGSVEIFAFGDSLKLVAFKKWCHKGPRDAFVKQLECKQLLKKRKALKLLGNRTLSKVYRFL